MKRGVQPGLSLHGARYGRPDRIMRYMAYVTWRALHGACHMACYPV